MKQWQIVLLCAALIIGLVPVIWWVLWSIWTWVLPQVWPDGPDAVIRPSYWLFVGELIVISIVGHGLFGYRGPK